MNDGYTVRDDIMDSKRNELAQSICVELQKRFPAYSDKIPAIVEDLLKNSIKMTAPMDPPFVMHMITVDSFKNYEKGSSTKPGNIRFNIKKIVDSATDIIASSVGIAMDIPILKVCGALNLWKALWNVMTIDIDKEHAIAIVALWQSCDNNLMISLEDGFARVNAFRHQLSEDQYSWERYMKIIDDLRENVNIQLLDSGIRLVEGVKVRYYN